MRKSGRELAITTANVEDSIGGLEVDRVEELVCDFGHVADRRFVRLVVCERT